MKLRQRFAPQLLPVLVIAGYLLTILGMSIRIINSPAPEGAFAVSLSVVMILALLNVAAVWTALGSQPAVIRISIGFAALLMLLAIWGGASIPLSFAQNGELFFSSAPFIIFAWLIVAVVFSFSRWIPWIRWQFGSISPQTSSPENTQQHVSLSQLFIAIAAIGVSCVILKDMLALPASVSDGVIDVQFQNQSFEIGVGSTALAIVCIAATIMFLCVWRWPTWLIITSLLALAGYECWTNSILSTDGSALPITIFALPLLSMRVSGMRLMRSRPSTKATDTSMSHATTPSFVSVLARNLASVAFASSCILFVWLYATGISATCHLLACPGIVVIPVTEPSVFVSIELGSEPGKIAPDQIPFAALRRTERWDHIGFSGPGLTDRHMREIGRLTHLATLDIDAPAITDAGFAELSHLKKLNYLLVRDAVVDDATFRILAELPELQSLALLDTKLEDTKGISKLTQLTQLYLIDSQISDFAPLKELTHLEHLDLQGPPVTADDIAMLQEALPDCQIKHSLSTPTTRKQ